MHRIRVYADTSVFGGVRDEEFAEPSREFFRRVAEEIRIALPPAGQYGVGTFFLPRDDEARAACEAAVEDAIEGEDLSCLGWRDVPVDESVLGRQAREEIERIVKESRREFIDRFTVPLWERSEEEGKG